MYFAKVYILVLAFFSCVVAEVENNSPYRGYLNVRSRNRVPYVNLRRRIPVVSYESAPYNKEATEKSTTHDSSILHSYSFDYKVVDDKGNTHYREEQADASGVVRGSYGYTDTQGLYRTVTYVADSTGFHVIIKSNEPGMSGIESPADVSLMVRERPDIIRDFNIQGGDGGVRLFGIRTRTEGGGGEFRLGPVVAGTYTPGENSLIPKEESDVYDKY